MIPEAHLDGSRTYFGGSNPPGTKVANFSLLAGLLCLLNIWLTGRCPAVAAFPNLEKTRGGKSFISTHPAAVKSTGALVVGRGSNIPSSKVLMRCWCLALFFKLRAKVVRFFPQVQVLLREKHPLVLFLYIPVCVYTNLHTKQIYRYK